MTFTFRVLLYKSSLFLYNKKATNVFQMLSLRETHNKLSNYPKSNITPRDNFLRKAKGVVNHKPPEKNSDFGLPSTIHKIDLSGIIQNADNLPRGIVIATFQKLRFIYYAKKDEPGFQRELINLSRSKVFNEFCKVIEKELPKLQPSYLSPLLDLIHFKISPQSVLMRKILVLILDNIHFFSPLDLIHLYCCLQGQHFRDIPECKSILEGCEKYFEKHLEEEMSHCHEIKDMSYLIHEEILPLKVRKILTERCLSLIQSNNYDLPSVPKFFINAFEEPILSLYKTELLDTFKLILEAHRLPKMQEIFSNLYRKIVIKNDSAYDEEICKMLTNNIEFVCTDSSFIKTLSCLCEIGYYDREAIEKAADLIVSVDLNNFSSHIILLLSSTLVDTSIHETNNPHWRKIKSQLESFDALRKFNHLPDLHLWCEFLTFLECDTTSLISSIFENYSANIGTENENSRSVLRLHHVCKKYFPDSGLGLKKKLLASCLQNSVYQKDFYEESCVNKFFGSSDYVLENCLTPDCHFLRPDNKPIDLSSYKSKDFNQFHRKSFSVTVNIENIKRPPGTKILVFLKYPTSRPFKFRNAPITSGFLKMFLKPYEGLNFNFILLPKKYFFLEDNEKLKYLSSEVNKIIESSDTASVKNEISLN